MKKFLNTMIFTMLLIVIAGAGIFAGYSAIISRENNSVAIPLENAVYQAAGIIPLTNVLAKPLPAQNNNTQALLNYDATLIFEYYHRYDGARVVEEQALPYFLAGKGIDDLSAIFSGWQIENYGENGALLKKDIAQPKLQHYLVTAQNGYIAVFYDEGIDGQKLKELTDTPISALPEPERERLSSGILIQGEDALIRLLEDLSS